MKLIKLLSLLCFVFNANVLMSQVSLCEKKINCQLDSLFKANDTSYQKRIHQEVIMVFVVSFEEDMKGKVEKILKQEGLNIDLNALKNWCSDVDFSCGNLFPESSKIQWYFDRRSIAGTCN